MVYIVSIYQDVSIHTPITDTQYKHKVHALKDEQTD